MMDESVGIVRQQLQDFYNKHFLLQPCQARKERRDELIKRARDFLDLANPSERLNRDIGHILLEQSATVPNWRAVSCVMQCMEGYAINLLDYPWKKEFHEILTYSGFYKAKLESCLQGPALEKLLSIIWYQRNANSFVLKSSPYRSVLICAALDFYLAAVECENYNMVHAAFKSKGLTTVGAMQFRLAHHGSVQACCDIIQQHYGCKMNEQQLELRGRSLVPSFSMDIKTCLTKDEWRDPSRTSCSTVVENASNRVWEFSGTLEEHSQMSRELLTEKQSRYRSPRERRRENREVADHIEQIRTAQRPEVLAMNDLAIDKSFPNSGTKIPTKRHLSQFHDKSIHTDQTESVILKGHHPKTSSALTVTDQEQKSYPKKRIERFDRIPVGNTEETVDNNKEFCRFISIQNSSTNSKLPLKEKTNRQLSEYEESQQSIFKKYKNKPIERSVTEKLSAGNVQQYDRETGNLQSVKAPESEKRTNSEIYDFNRKRSGQQRCGVEKQWQCETCTLVNKPSESICRTCNRSRNCGADEKPLETGSRRQCSRCTFVSSRLSEKCEICGNVLTGSSTYI